MFFLQQAACISHSITVLVMCIVIPGICYCRSDAARRVLCTYSICSRREVPGTSIFARACVISTAVACCTRMAQQYIPV